MTRSAVDCLRRAGLSLRANLPLILLALLQGVVTVLLFVVSLVPPVLVVGGLALIEGGLTLPAVEEWAAESWLQIVAAPLPFALAVLASTLLGLLAVYVWGWFQGGIFGTLVAAERQALPDAQDRAGGAQWFRTFSLSEFSGWGGRYAWRYFWFFHLSLTVGLGLLLVAALLFLAVAFGYEAWGGGAAYGIGCGALLPLSFAFLVYALWNVTAQPFLATPEGRVLRAAGAGLRLIGRRVGAVLLIVATLIVVGVALGMALVVFDFAAGLLGEERFAVQVALLLFVTLVRTLVNAALGVFADAAFTSLAVAQAPEVLR